MSHPFRTVSVDDGHVLNGRRALSLTSDLKAPKTGVGRWARDRFANARSLYPLLNGASEPVLVRPDGWGDGRDQRWSWAGMACDTMLRWRLGVDGAAGVAQAGARRLVGDLDGSDLGHLLAAAPALDDTLGSARLAVLWALAEQHARYARTENPLTPVADQPADDLLSCVPDEVVADVAAVFDGPAAGLADAVSKFGPVTAGTAFRYPGGADLDLLAGAAIVEVKTTTSRRGLTDVLQPLCYALLSEPGTVDTLVWAFPRAGKTLELPVADVIAQTADPTDVTVGALRGELSQAAGIAP